MPELRDFVQLSRYAGERFDLIQAGGGNSSVKLPDGTMLIKASGFSLSEVCSEKGFARVDNVKILDILSFEPLLVIRDKREQEALASVLIRETLLGPDAKPSIETFLHALLDRYTLHTHPLAVNAITCRPDWADILADLFPMALCVPYQTPGLKLALELKQQLDRHLLRHGQKPQLVFLQNHGLIVSEASAAAVRSMTEAVLERIEAFLGVDLKAHKLVTRLSDHFAAEPDRPIAYRSRDAELAQLVAEADPDRLAKAFCPDGFVFCGFRPVRLEGLSNPGPLRDYETRYRERPKVILHADSVFILADSVRKAKEIEDVFRFHVMTLAMAGPEVSSLADQELAYLANWEAETYRQKL